MSKAFLRSAVACALAVLVLTGCGGGAGDVGAQEATSAPPAVRHPPPPDAGKAVAPVLSSPVRASANDEPSVREHIAQLRSEVAAIRLQLARMPHGSASADEDRDPQADEAARAESERAVAADVQSREASFRVEHVDAVWSRSTAEILRNALSLGNNGGSVPVQSIECRSRSCRVVVDMAAAAAVGQDLPGAFSELAQTLPNVATGEIDLGAGRRLTVVYLSR